MLRVIQLNILEDRSVNDKREWDQAVRFLETSVKEKLQSTEQILRDMLGPNRKERWLYWQYQTEEQEKRTAVKSELDKILYADKVREKCNGIQQQDKILQIIFRYIRIFFFVAEACTYSHARRAHNCQKKFAAKRNGDR